jgi:hypothetical protein
MFTVGRFDAAARVLSIVGLPPVLAVPTALLAGLSAGGFPSTVPSLAELLLAACLVPTVFTIVLFRSGRTSSLDLRERAERLAPSVVTASCCCVAWLVMQLSGAPRSLTLLAIALCAQMVLLALLTMRWKVSYHAASAGALVVVSHALGNTGLTCALLAMALSIGWARVHQGRHTPAQVAIGALTCAPLALVS